MKFPLLPALLVAASLATPLHAADTSSADRAQIQQLIERFKAAIIAKDGQAMRAMFLPGGSWLQGFDKPSLAKVQTKKPGTPQFKPGNYEQFATFVGTAPKSIEETFDNVHIQSDGTVGIVYFDYRFLIEGKSSNHGAETWQLVHTDDGWKISAMLYSVVLDDMH